MTRKVGEKVRYKDPVTGEIFDAVIVRIIKGRPIQYVLNIKGGNIYMGGRIAYSNEIWTKRRKKGRR